MTALRYIDLLLVVMAGPAIIAAGGATTGYAFGAGGWILARAGTEYFEHRARGADSTRAVTGAAVAGMMGRVWVAVLAVVAARVVGDKDDGVMAAVIVLAAFSVYFALSILLRQIGKKPVGS